MATPLVVIDVQNGFVNDRSRHVVPVISDLVAAWERAEHPVLFSRYFNYPDSPFVRILGWTGLQEEPSTGIVPELADAAARHTILDKVRYSTFTPELVDTFRDIGWGDVVLCGIATDSCVLQTAVDFFEAGITPWIVTDGCASEAGDDVHQAGLTVLGRMVGRPHLITAADALARFTPAAKGAAA